MIKFTIKMPPVTKKNSQRILVNKAAGKRFVAPSEQYKEYERLAAWFIPRPDAPIEEAVNVKCLFYMPTKRRVDLTNLLEAVDDVMVKAGLLKDDHSGIVAAHDGSRVLYDKDDPRTEVEISGHVG